MAATKQLLPGARAVTAIVIALAVFATACGGGETVVEEEVVSSTSDSTEAAAPEATEPSAAEPTAAPAADPTAVPEPTPEPTTAPEPDPEPTPEPAPAEDDGAVLPAEQVATVQFTGSMPDIPEGLVTPLPDAGPYPEAAGGIASSADGPVAMGTPFIYNDRDVQWEINLHGVLPVEPTFSSDEGSACWLLMGSLTALHVVEGNEASDSIHLPDFAALMGDDLVEDKGSCSDRVANQAGFFDKQDADLIAGGSMDFYTAILFEEIAEPAVQAIVVGETDEEQVTYLTPTVLSSPPALIDRAPADLPEVPSVVDAVVVTQSTDRWAMRLHGLVETTAEQRSIDDFGEGTTCLVLLAEGFPVEIDEGSVSDNEPSFDLVAGGQLLDDGITSCDIDRFEAAGYQWHAAVHQTPGTPIAFMDAFVVPSGLVGSVTHVVVGEFGGDDAVFMTAETIDSIPAVPGPPSEPMLPTTSGPMDAQTWTFTEPNEELSWQIDTSGMVEVGPTLDGTGRCLAVVGTMTPDMAADKGFQAPDVWLIAEGTAIDALDRNCDREALEAAGYAPWTDFELEAGEAHNFYALIQLPNEPQRTPSTLAFGRAARDSWAIYLDPVRLDAIPPLG